MSRGYEQHGRRHGADGSDPIRGLKRLIEVVVDGGGAEIVTGVAGDLYVDFDCTILAWTLLADESGDVEVAVWKSAYVDFPPTVGDSILTASISGAQTGHTDGLAIAVSAGDCLRFNVDSVSSIQRVTLALSVSA